MTLTAGVVATKMPKSTLKLKRSTTNSTPFFYRATILGILKHDLGKKINRNTLKRGKKTNLTLKKNYILEKIK